MTQQTGSLKPQMKSVEAMLTEQAEIAEFLVQKTTERHSGVKAVALMTIRQYFASFEDYPKLAPKRRETYVLKSVDQQLQPEGTERSWEHGSGKMMGLKALDLAKGIQDGRYVRVPGTKLMKTLNRFRAICIMNNVVTERDQRHAQRQLSAETPTTRTGKHGTKLTLVHDSGRRKPKRKQPAHKQQPHRRNANDGKRRATSRKAS